MGCHTLTYKRLRKLTDKEQSAILECEMDWLLDNIPQEFEDIWGIVYNAKTTQEVQEKMQSYPFYGAEKMIDGIIQDITHNSNAEGIIVDGYLYEYLFSDTPFRMFGYPNETFTDANSLIDFISKEENKGMISYNKGNNEYTNEVTDELITRIHSFFAEHKDILVKFG